MNGRIVRIRSDGFKGLEFEDQLTPGVIVCGPNGSGKSARLEAIVYALSGRVPTGKSLDEVARYFGPRGGTVELMDEDGHWIRRGITRDREKAKISETIDYDDEGGEDRWEADPAVLDLREFLNLSPNKRREFILEICGTGQASREELYDVIEAEYARKIAGAAATAETLRDPDSLPEAEAQLAKTWTEERGMREVLVSYLLGNPDGTASEFCQKLADVAREGKNVARAGAVKARGVVDELEHQVQGARAAAADMERASTERADAIDAHIEASKLKGERAEREKSAEHYRRLYGTQEQELAAAKDEAAALKDPGPEPEVTGVIDAFKAHEEFEARKTEAHEPETRCKDVFERYHKAISDASTTEAELQKIKEEIEKLNEWPQAKLNELMADPPDGVPCWDWFDDLREAVDACSKVWHDQCQRFENRKNDNEIALATYHADADVLKPEFEAAEVTSKNMELELTAIAFEEQAWDEKRKLDEGRHRAELDARRNWLTEKEAIDFANREVQEAQKILNRSHDELNRINAEILKSSRQPMADFAATQERLGKSDVAVEKASAAMGVVRAYDEAIELKTVTQLAEKAWAAAEKSIKRAREIYVGNATKVILEDLQFVIDALWASRTDEAEPPPPKIYLDLENERGKPIFDLGWVSRGQDSPDVSLGPVFVKTSLSSLSGGEAVLFCAALSMAFSRRSKGRRVLLLEAAELDASNLGGTIDGLGLILEELDACIVATSSGYPTTRSWEGWTVQQLGQKEVEA